MTTCGKKNTKHAHELQDCPPKALVDLWFWFVSFSLFVFACFELGPFILGLVYHNRKNHESHDKEKTTTYFSHGNTRLMLRNMHFVKLCPRGCMWLPLDQTTYKTLFSKLLKPSHIFKHLQILSQNHVKSMDVSWRFPWGQTPLFDAAERGCVSVVEQLLKSGASVGAQSENGLGLNGKGQGNLGKIWWLMYVDVPMYNFNYICYRNYTFPYTELPLCRTHSDSNLSNMTSKLGQSELFLRMRGGVFVGDRREEYNVMLARRCWCKFRWVATFSEIMPNVRDKQTCECGMVHLDTPKVYRKPKAGDA